MQIEKSEIGSETRPVGNMRYLLEDLKLRGLECNTVLDVGANCADWSRMAKSVFPDAKFHLIEPQVEMKERLEQFCIDFPGSTFSLLAAGSEKGILTLTIWDDLAGSSFLPKPDEQLRAQGKQRDIEIITINELITSSRIQIPEIIKLDIQGFELEALKGATLTFGHTEVYILEVSLFSFDDVPGMPVILSYGYGSSNMKSFISQIPCSEHSG